MRKKKPIKISSPALRTATVLTSNYVNLNYLQKIAGGDIGFMSDIINLFLQQSPENIRYLNFYAQQKDWGNLKKLAHKMRSPITLVGIEKSLDLLTKLEEDIHNAKSLESIPFVVHLFTEIWKKAYVELQLKLNNLQQNGLTE